MSKDKNKKDDITIYTETPATGINNGVNVTPSVMEQQETEKEADKNFKEENQEAKKDEKEKTDTGGEAG